MIVGCSLLARGMLLRRAQASLYGRVRERERELQVLNERLGEESRRDPLTGLGNRLRLAEDMSRSMRRADRYEHGYCLVLCDLDRFKAYNDGWATRPATTCCAGSPAARAQRARRRPHLPLRR